MASKAEARRWLLRRTVFENPFVPVTPTPKQARFLLHPAREVFYGGQAGGGKSEALLTAAAQYVQVPGYAAMIFRRTFQDLSLPGALLDRALEWWSNSDAHWNALTKTWSFPSGATISFGYLDSEKDKYRYQGSELQFVGFDELTQFTETQYLYLLSRLRKPKGMWVPLRQWSAGNPGGVGHDWVKARFVTPGTHFVAAGLDDNPHIDAATYREGLAQLDWLTRQQLAHGDWDATLAGDLFQGEWFVKVTGPAPEDARRVRYWDLAATEAGEGKDPDWTVGVLVAMFEGRFWVEDIRRVRRSPRQVEALIRATAEADGPGVEIGVEQEPGSAGKSLVDHYRRTVLAGFAMRGDRPTGSKLVRARPAAAKAEAGDLMLVDGPWVDDFVEELVQFPDGSHDDQVDALSGAIGMLTRGAGPRQLAGTGTLLADMTLRR